ncbi:Golgi SNAP receptor complex member 2 [Halotydeus destructor]|nr:Golgi SNAP receptor complex member 2 [Halotydeus destructor]
MSRDELFRRREDTGRHGSNDWQSGSQGKDHESINIDSYMDRERSTLLNSHREIDDMLTQGAEVMGSLRHQRHVLKNARTKMFDIATNLGMSNTVMQFIEKRASKDKMILYLGMIVFTLFMFLVWFYLL